MSSDPDARLDDRWNDDHRAASAEEIRGNSSIRGLHHVPKDGSAVGNPVVELESLARSIARSKKRCRTEYKQE